MWLLFDIGNTRLKWQWADGEKLFVGGSMPLPAAGDELKALVHDVVVKHRPVQILISNVAGGRFDVALEQWSLQTFEISPYIVTPTAHQYGIVNGYDDPSSLGVDRWCGLIGARSRYSGDLFVIDCGTAVTLDVLSRFGEHRGGLIIPGIHSMIRALTLSANNIRLGTKVGEGLVALGHSTGECLRAGALTAIAGSIEFTLRHLTTEVPYTVMLTGGDASTIAAVIEHPARVEPDLVFFGLAEIARAR